MSETPEIAWPVARYMLTGPAYVPRAPGEPCEMLDPNDEKLNGRPVFIVFDGPPSAVMEPTDEAGFRAKSQLNLIRSQRALWRSRTAAAAEMNLATGFDPSDPPSDVELLEQAKRVGTEAEIAETKGRR